MELLEQLKTCRAGAIATLQVLDLLIDRVSSLSALVAPVPSPSPHTVHALPPMGRGRPGTRMAVLAAMKDWMTADDVVKATVEIASPASVYKMLQALAADGKLKRRGSRGSFQYALAGRARAKALKAPATKTKPQRGATKPAVLALAADWTPGIELSAALVAQGFTRPAVHSAIHALIGAKRLERRGKNKTFQYRATPHK